MRARNSPTVVSIGRSLIVNRFGAGSEGDRMWIVIVRNLPFSSPLGAVAAAAGESLDAMRTVLEAAELCRMEVRDERLRT